jgi:hypothetical protein
MKWPVCRKYNTLLVFQQTKQGDITVSFFCIHYINCVQSPSLHTPVSLESRFFRHLVVLPEVHQYFQSNMFGLESKYLKVLYLLLNVVLLTNICVVVQWFCTWTCNEGNDLILIKPHCSEDTEVSHQILESVIELCKKCDWADRGVWSGREWTELLRTRIWWRR